MDLPLIQILDHAQSRITFALVNNTDENLNATSGSGGGFFRHLNASFYSIDESMPVDTAFALITAHLDGDPSRTLSFLHYTVKPLSDDLDFFLAIETRTGSVTLIRELDSALVSHLAFRVFLSEHVSYDLTILVNDTNNQAPELELDPDEARKFGETNLLITSIDNFQPILEKISRDTSSTAKPPVLSLPPIPEVGLMAERFNPAASLYRTLELDQNTDLLKRFNGRRQIKVFKISDNDLANNFSVRFVENQSSPEVLANYQVCSVALDFFFNLFIAMLSTHILTA